MGRWAHFSERPEARAHYFERSEWYQPSALSACGERVYTMRLSAPEDSGRPKCVKCLCETQRSR
jgi:hypothetical protein